ncbi:MAG: hypothetical protein JWM54_777 [Acidobacteriaceae bacterium]|nr:hypothetical protein [Acidobacteriaceae bacterium]
MASAGNGSGGGFLSEQKGPAEERSWLPWIAAGTVVVIALVVVLLSGHRDRARQEAEGAVHGPDPYAPNLSVNNLKMSEAENFAGGKVTYVDGEISNRGDKTVTGVNVAVTFMNDVGEPPQVVPMPLSLIRMREPYVDIEPVTAEPLKPGETHEFRLIFDHISPVWNQQYPSVVPTRVQTR